MNAAPDDVRGPDRTLVQLAEWLTQNASAFDALFAETRGLVAVHIVETLTEQHPEEEHEATTSVARFSFEFSNGRKVERRNTDMLSGASSRLLRSAHADGSGIRSRCFINSELFFHETFTLTVHSDEGAECTIRHWDFDNLFGHQELMEQSLSWRREQGRYIGQGIEMRLYGPNITSWIRNLETNDSTLLENPARIFEHPDDLPLIFHPAAFRVSGGCMPDWVV